MTQVEWLLIRQSAGRIDRETDDSIISVYYNLQPYPEIPKLYAREKQKISGHVCRFKIKILVPI